ncbi:MAG: VOC family protein [Alphaproteobacteria bacterium]|nr:VOC family protein [Alphaproteobacteria bacterium]
MTTGRLRYLAYLSEDPDMMADFYGRHLELEELGRSNAGDVSLTDGFFNITFLKAREDLGELDNTIGLHHVGLQVDDMDRVITKYRDRNPRGEVIEEEGGMHFGEVRIFDPECRVVTLSSSDFGIGGEARRLPRIAHIAFNALDPTSVLQFYSELFGFRELDTSFERREQERKNRFAGDGFTNLAIHPFFNSTLEGHEARFGVNHIGFLVSDIDDKLENFAKEIPTAPRPSTRPYAEYRVRDPEQNGVDLSKTKGWEIDLGKWETAA